MTTFKPHTPEKKIIVRITAKEAHLIKILRGYEYGKILVHKASGVIVRAEPTESQIVNEDDGLDLAIKEE